MGKRQGLFSTVIQTPRLIPFALLRIFFNFFFFKLVSSASNFYYIFLKILFVCLFVLQWKGCGRPPSGGAAGGWLAGVCNPIRLRFSLKKSLYNMAKSRITCREGDG